MRLLGRDRLRYSCTIAVLGCGLIASQADAMPNPASAFCSTMDGRLVMAKLGDGNEVGLCYLPGRAIIEEWTLYRMLKGQKPPPGQSPF